MATPTEKFFAGLFDERDFVNLTRNTSVSLTIGTASWLGSFFFPGKTGEISGMKSSCLTVAVLMGCASIFFAIRREKPLRKKTMISAIEDNDFAHRGGIVTGLNIENSAQHLEECLKQKMQP